VDGCQICGRTPTAEFKLAWNTGLIVLNVSHRLNATLCRTHGRAASLAYLGKTLVFGWWGFISFFINFIVVGVDIRALLRAVRLPEPDGGTTPNDLSFRDWERARQAAAKSAVNPGVGPLVPLPPQPPPPRSDSP
jgi:hypothetical protein